MSIFTDFHNGLRIIFGKPKPGEGDRRLAQMSESTIALIPQFGKDAVRKQVIKSISSDLKRNYKKGGKAAVDKLIDNALGTPEYMKLLRKLDLGEPHIRVMAREVFK